MKKQIAAIAWMAFGISAAHAAESMVTVAAPTESSASPAAGASATASTSVGGGSALDKVYMGVTSTFHGSTLPEFGSAQSMNRLGVQNKRGGETSNVNFDSEAGLGYLLSKDVAVGVVVPFFYYPVAAQGFVLGDVGVKLAHKHLISRNGFNLSANLIAQASTSDYSQSAFRDQSFALKSTPSWRYNFAHSDFAVGTYHEFKEYFGVANDKTFKVWMLPYANYRVSRSFSLNLGYEMEWDHFVNQPGFFALTTYQTDLQPGFIWSITPKVSVNPYLQINTMNYVSLKTTGVGAFINAAIL